MNLFEYLKTKKLPYKVWDIINGWVEVVELSDSDNNYPIKVKYLSSKTNSGAFTKDGKHFKSDKYPTLYLNEHIIDDPIPVPTFKAGDTVFLTENVADLRPYLIHSYDDRDGMYFIRESGKMGHNVVNHAGIELATPEVVDRRCKYLKHYLENNKHNTNE